VKAAVCYEFGKPLVIEDLEIRAPGFEEVKVKNAATAVCHSDIHFIRGELPFSPPIVAGHETAGYVEEVGEGVTGFAKGDHVVASVLISCGECLQCRNGRPGLCERQHWERDDVSPYTNARGEHIPQAFRVGGFAEYTIVHKSQLVRLPQDFAFDRASLLACGVMTGFGAVVWRARVRPGSSCAIVGAGGVGLNAVQGACLSGADPIIAVDVNERKLQAAKAFGATHTVNSAKVDAIEAVRDLTAGRGADYVFVTVGSGAAMEQSILMSGARGLTVWVGVTDAPSIPISPFAMLRDERALAGCWIGSANPPVDIPKLIDLYDAGKLKLDKLISGHYPLEHVNEAVTSVERGEALRNIIVFD
jgi:S-(hydroxymethyl)glutathione dehydrogenase / alcohol dehydrogenase